MPVAIQRPIRVMLVDDHQSMLWGLRKLIESDAPRMQVVYAASSRAEALAGVREHNPDVVLLDLDLGQDSGLDVLDELAANDGAKFIVLTGARDAAAREHAVRAGARGLIHKSEPAEVILRAIASVHAGDLWFDRATLASLYTAFCGSRSGGASRSASNALTPAERRVIAAVVRHKSAPNKVIADELCISTHTLRNHLASIYDKLGLHRRLDLVLYTLERRPDLGRPAPPVAPPAERSSARNGRHPGGHRAFGLGNE
jgi:two-component system, NarL family, nitrate/nitrite response regulator NarL